MKKTVEMHVEAFEKKKLFTDKMNVKEKKPR